MNTTGRLPVGLIFGGMALAALAVVRIIPVSGYFPPCAFKSLFGVPCPTCGSGRTLGELSVGHIADAFIMNPLFSLAIVGSAAALFLDVIMLLFSVSPEAVLWTSRRVNLLRSAALFLFFLNWAYLIIANR